MAFSITVYIYYFRILTTSDVGWLLELLFIFIILGFDMRSLLNYK